MHEMGLGECIPETQVKMHEMGLGECITASLRRRPTCMRWAWVGECTPETQANMHEMGLGR
eukprot:1161210-Pelagomonas_calceolata.AAC.20